MDGLLAGTDGLLAGTDGLLGGIDAWLAGSDGWFASGNGMLGWLGQRDGGVHGGLVRVPHLSYSKLRFFRGGGWRAPLSRW